MASQIRKEALRKELSDKITLNMATRKMPVKNPSSMSNQWTKENGEQGILLDPLNAVQTGFRLTTG